MHMDSFHMYQTTQKQNKAQNVYIILWEHYTYKEIANSYATGTTLCMVHVRIISRCVLKWDLAVKLRFKR